MYHPILLPKKHPSMFYQNVMCNNLQTCFISNVYGIGPRIIISLT